MYVCSLDTRHSPEKRILRNRYIYLKDRLKLYTKQIVTDLVITPYTVNVATVRLSQAELWSGTATYGDMCVLFILLYIIKPEQDKNAKTLNTLGNQ